LFFRRLALRCLCERLQPVARLLAEHTYAARMGRLVEAMRGLFGQG